MTLEPLRIAVLGLGAAGRVYARDLARASLVRAFDPLFDGNACGSTAGPTAGSASGSDLEGVTVEATAADAVRDADLILALTAASDARTALESAVAAARPGAVYADLSSGSPQLKTELAGLAASAGLLFADAVLMAPVARRRIETLIIASGPGAGALAELLADACPVTIVSEVAGEAAARKLLRSIVVKGVTALMVESLRAAEEQGVLDWFSDHVTETLTAITPDLLRELLDGTEQHSARRIHEMQAATEMVEAAGLTASMSRATVEVLESVGDTRIPRAGVLAREARHD